MNYKCLQMRSFQLTRTIALQAVLKADTIMHSDVRRSIRYLSNTDPILMSKVPCPMTGDLAISIQVLMSKVPCLMTGDLAIFSLKPLASTR